MPRPIYLKVGTGMRYHGGVMHIKQSLTLFQNFVMMNVCVSFLNLSLCIDFGAEDLNHGIFFFNSGIFVYHVS